MQQKLFKQKKLGKRETVLKTVIAEKRIIKGFLNLEKEFLYCTQMFEMFKESVFSLYTD